MQLAPAGPMNNLYKVGVGTLSLAFGSLLLASKSGAGAAAASIPGVEETVQRTGTIDAWHVLANGTVAVHLVGQNKDQPFALWLVTPGDRTQSTRFEDQVLYTVFAFIASKQELTFSIGIRNEKTEKSGKTLKEAIPIEAMMSGSIPIEEPKEKKTAPTTLGK